MNDDIYIYSTMTGGVDYAFYQKFPEGKADGGAAKVEKKITINGGSNVPDKQLRTPIGVVTRISKDDYELLKEHPVFKQHVDGKFIIVSEAKVDPAKVVPDMKSRDSSAPLVPQDYTDRKESDNTDPDRRFPLGARFKSAADLEKL